MKVDKDTLQEVVALFPAGGHATRLGMLPCSKEILPIGNVFSPNDNLVSLPVACSPLLSAYRSASIKKLYVILRNGKWDIPAYLDNGSAQGFSIAYLIRQYPYGVPFTLDQAYPYLDGKLVALGFPDIIFEPNDAFQKLVQRQQETQADIVLGLFSTDTPEKVDMVKTGLDGQVECIDIKPKDTLLDKAWILALWTPAFTYYLHQFVETKLDSIAANPDSYPELHFGQVIQSAIDDGVGVNSVFFPEGRFIDIGTLNHLNQVISSGFHEEK